MRIFNEVLPFNLFPKHFITRPTSPYDFNHLFVAHNLGALNVWPVSYTHLDVYKRQVMFLLFSGSILNADYRITVTDYRCVWWGLMVGRESTWEEEG